MKTRELHGVLREEAHDAQRTLLGAIITRPSLLGPVKTDGENSTYACNVRINGQDEILRNVPIAVGVGELVYAEVGAAVTLQRNQTGRYEIIGFAKRKPGTRKRVPVDLVTSVIGAIQDLSITVRPLTFGELGDPAFGAGFGSIPFGATGVFQAGVLIEVN